jgi:hypothetical protein
MGSSSSSSTAALQSCDHIRARKQSNGTRKQQYSGAAAQRPAITNHQGRGRHRQLTGSKTTTHRFKAGSSGGSAAAQARIMAGDSTAEATQRLTGSEGRKQLTDSKACSSGGPAAAQQRRRRGSWRVTRRRGRQRQLTSSEGRQRLVDSRQAAGDSGNSPAAKAGNDSPIQGRQQRRLSSEAGEDRGGRLDEGDDSGDSSVAKAGNNSPIRRQAAAAAQRRSRRGSCRATRQRGRQRRLTGSELEGRQRLTDSRQAAAVAQ